MNRNEKMTRADFAGFTSAIEATVTGLIMLILPLEGFLELSRALRALPVEAWA